MTRLFPPDHAQAILARVTADITRGKNLNPSRRHRTYPRAVKRYRHNFYRSRKPGDHGTRHHSPPTIQLATTLTSTAA